LMRNLCAGMEQGLGTEPRPPGKPGDLLNRWARSVGCAFAALQSVDPFRLATSGLWTDGSEVSGELCDLCGNGLRISTLADALSTAGFRRYDCVHCASRRLEPTGSGPGCVHVSLGRGHDGGHELVVKPEVTRNESVQLVWRPEFKGMQGRQHSRRAVLEFPASFPILVPDEVTDQLHTVRVIAIVGAHIWTWRTRLKVR